MLVNHQYKFLFVHIQKTAGSSITGKLLSLPGTVRIANQHSFVSHVDMSPYRNYYKFCFVRNPWDRLVSWWNMMESKGDHNDFSHYLLKAGDFNAFLSRTAIINETMGNDKLLTYYPKSIAFNQLDYITGTDGLVSVDFVGRFENLRDDFKAVCEHLGIPFSLPHMNKGKQAKYWNYYTDESREKVRQLYKRDIDYFNYAFQPAPARKSRLSRLGQLFRWS